MPPCSPTSSKKRTRLSKPLTNRIAKKLCEELGDLLLQIIFHSQIACERGQFAVADVIDALANKMIRRHPHVFGDASISTSQEQMKSWELIKTQEASIRHRESLLDGVPKSLPSLLHAQRIQEKAGTIGFDWPTSARHHGETRGRARRAAARHRG